MPRLEAPGHEERLADVQRGFRRASHRRHGADVRKQVRQIGSVAGLMMVGVVIGAAGFVLVDSLRPPEKQTRDGVLSLRGPYYASCREAFQDGRANIRRGEPGYRAELDADNDGLACEPYIPLKP